MILQTRINNGPRASLTVVHLTSVLFGKMDLSGLRHSSNIVCPAIIPNILVHSTRSDRAALVARVFRALKCILKCSEYLIPFMFLTNAVDIQGLIQCVYTTNIFAPDGVLDGWQLAFQASKLPEIALRSAAKASAESGTRGLECRVLGIARSPPELSGPLQDQIGSLRVLSSPEGGRRSAVLCAHVRGPAWLCYSFDDSDAGHKFDIDRLVLEDVESMTLPDPVEEELDPLMRFIHQNKPGFFPAIGRSFLESRRTSRLFMQCSA